MNRIKLVLSLLVLISVQVVGFSAWAAEPAMPRCNCYYPNSGEYGFVYDGDCESTPCWIAN